MAKFQYIEWLIEYLFSQVVFVFEWDDGNSSKIFEKHGIENEMVESAFYDLQLLVLGKQYQPIANEDRYGIIGKATNGDILFICFTFRGNKVRPISSRFANLKERRLYEQEIR